MLTRGRWLSCKTKPRLDWGYIVLKNLGIDDIPIVEWYTSESPHAFPVISDDGVPPKVTEEVENV